VISKKYMDLTVEDHTPSNCKRKWLKIYSPRRVFFGYVLWDRHWHEYRCDMEGTTWNSAALIQIGEFLNELNKENAEC